jgi:NDP-sugar pyrophosphorylase family protein
MAGEGIRFRTAGYETPKWGLPLVGHTVLEWSLLSFSNLFETEKVTIVHREEEATTDFLKSAAKRVGIVHLDVVRLEERTRGQAETVSEGLSQVSVTSDESLTIFNIDTLRPGYEPGERQQASDGWLECVHASGDHWSFVLEDHSESGRVQSVSEKKRISENCSTGLDYFSQRQIFDEAYAEECSTWNSGEIYVAPLHKRAVTNECRVFSTL